MAAIVVAALVAAAVVLVPRIRAVDVAGNLRWLRDNWATAETFDSARTTAVLVVRSRAVPGDQVVYRSAIVAVDDEEAAALSRMTSGIRHHGTGAADVRRLRNAMVAALTAELLAVRADASAPDDAIDGISSVAGDWRPQLFAVDSQLASTLSHHHVRSTAHSQLVTFHGAEPALAQLSALVDEPLTGWLIVSGLDPQPDLVHLPDGATRQLAQLPSNLPDGVVGTTAYSYLGPDDFSLVDVLTGRRLRLRDVREAIATVSGRFWLELHDGRVEQIDSGGTVTQPPRRPPHPGLDLLSATDDTIVLGQYGPQAPRDLIAWQPATGRTHRYGCEYFRAPSHRLVLHQPCTGDPSTFVVGDPLLGGGRTIVPPRGFVFDQGLAITPDGGHVAMGLRGVGAHRVTPGALGVFDVHSGRWTITPTETVIVDQWAADGRQLYLTTEPVDGYVRFAVWSYSDPRVRYLRLPRDVQNIWPVPGGPSNAVVGELAG
jgi:hypothetical protein